MRVEQYSILIAETTRELVKLVNMELKDGWEPHGSVFINERGYPSQPVVRYTSPNQS